jgi:hypothetical protein
MALPHDLLERRHASPTAAVAVASMPTSHNSFIVTI